MSTIQSEAPWMICAGSISTSSSSWALVDESQTLYILLASLFFVSFVGKGDPVVASSGYVSFSFEAAVNSEKKDNHI
ncbi:hypothetical protein VTO73DRAFT_14379 [Trametes versicolor]